MSLKLTQIRVAAGRFQLGPVHATADKGQMIAVLGPNGSGKTTLLRAIAGLHPFAGQMSWRGQDMAGWSVHQRAASSAWCPAECTTPFAFSCRDVVIMGLFALHQGQPTPEHHRRVNAALEEVGMSSFARRPITSLSSGERQRIFLARTLVANTPLLLLDEPTSNLDPKWAFACMDLLKRRTQNSGTTVVLVLHDLTLASQTADQIWLLSPKGLVSGSTTAILTPLRIKEIFGIDSTTKDLPSGRRTLVLFS